MCLWPSPPALCGRSVYEQVLHGTNVQRYETPIAVYQTMRLDQIMWNCIAAYHATALDAISNISAMTRPPVTSATAAYHTSQNRVLCSAHAINGLLVAGLNVLAAWSARSSPGPSNYVFCANASSITGVVM